MKYLLQLNVAVVALCIAAHAQTGGSISGTIVDENSVGVAGAQVVIQELAVFARSAAGQAVLVDPGSNTSLTADTNGNFSMSGLTAGTYEVCGFGTTPSQVSDCDWTGVGTITLQANQTLMGVTRSVTNGVLITINVADPNARLAGSKYFYVGLGDSSIYHRAQLMSPSATGRSFQIGVPKNRTLSFFIDTDTPVSILDDNGVTLELERLTSETISTGATAQMTVNVTIQ